MRDNRALSASSLLGSRRRALGVVGQVALVAGLFVSTAAVGDPPSSDVIGGVPVSLNITSPSPAYYYGDEVAVEATCSVDADAPSGGSAVVLLIDLSMSTQETLLSGSCADFNGDGLSNRKIDCLLAASANLVEQMAEVGNVDEVSVVIFQHHGAAVDLSPASGIQTFVAPGADVDNDDVLDVVEALLSTQIYLDGEDLQDGHAKMPAFTTTDVGYWRSGTHIGDGLEEACDVADGSSKSTKKILLFTDGVNNHAPALEDVLPCDPNVPVYAFGLGYQGRCAATYVTGELGNLADSVPTTGGACYSIAAEDIYALPDVLEGFVTPVVSEARVSMDGGTAEALDELSPALPWEGFGDVAMSWLAEDLGTSAHEVCVQVDVAVGADSSTLEDCVTITKNLPPTLDFGADLVKDEGETFSLDAAIADDPNDDALSTVWDVQTLNGLPLGQPGAGQQAASWFTLDDGLYDIHLTVSDGHGEAEDTTRVRVRNVEPTVAWNFFDGVGGGIVNLSGLATDPGVLDVLSTTVDWGDGQIETVHPPAAGPGWSTFAAGHAYDEPGDYVVVLTVIDHDGGRFVDMATAHSSAPVAVWATSTSGRRVLDWSGCGGSISGYVHSNADLWITGCAQATGCSSENDVEWAGKAFAGTVEHTTGLHARGEVSFATEPVTAAPAVSPANYVLADWLPDGPKATFYGEHYIVHTCDEDGEWKVETDPGRGIHFAPCDIVIDVPAYSMFSSTFVATGRVDVQSSQIIIGSYGEALVMLAGSAEDGAARVSGSNNLMHGYVAAPAGGVEVSGQNLSLLCGLVGDRVDISGANLTINADLCTSVSASGLPPIVVPKMTATLASEPSSVAPLGVVTSSAEVSFDEAELVIAGVVGGQNLGGSPATITGLNVNLSIQLEGGGWASEDIEWHAVGLPTSSGAAPLLVEGGDPVVLPAGEKMYWSAWARAHVTGEQLEGLMAAAAVGELRADLSLSGLSGMVLDMGSHVSVEFGAGSVTDTQIAVIRADGTTQLINSASPGAAALASLGANETVTFEIEAAPPALAPIREGESNEAYVERLLAAEASKVQTSLYAVGDFGGVRALAPMVMSSVDLDVPVLRAVGSTLPTSVASGDAVDLRLGVANVSQTSALSVEGTRAVGTATVATTLTSPLAAHASSVATGSYTYLDSDAGTSPAITRHVTWQDAEANVYGPLALDGVAAVAAVPTLSLSLVDSLSADNDSNSVITEDDEVALHGVVRAGPSAGLSGVVVTLPLDGVLVTDSATASQGTVSVDTVGGVTTVTFTVGTLAAGGSAWVEAKVVAPSSASMTHQAAGVATGVTSVASDDPSVPGHTNSTVTHIVGADAEVLARLTWQQLVDIDGNGVPSPGDTLRYEGAVYNFGLASASDVFVTVPLDTGSTLVAGTAAVSTGTVVTGSLSTDDEVVLDVGTLATNATTTWSFDVEVGFIASLNGTLETQGEVVFDTSGAAVTDDPRTEAAFDATVISVGTTPYPDRTGYTGPFPTVTFITPLPGARIAVPTGIVADVAPTEGNTLVWWRATMWEEGTDMTPVVLSTGTTAPPADPDPLASVDPTLLRNGLWTVRVEAIDSAGLRGWADAPLEIAGDFKPGGMRVAFVDGKFALPVGGDLEVIRAYDTLDRHASSDFGHGWTLSMTNMRIQTNGPLGDGGFGLGACDADDCGEEECPTGGFYNMLCFETVKPHLVVLTWPDGRQEAWDFLPSPVSSYFTALAEPNFRPHPGTTSTLAVGPGTGTGFFVAEVGNIYGGFGGGAGYFAPQSYVVMTADGTAYTVGIQGAEVTREGLSKIEDRFGNTTTFTDDGVITSLGADLLWDRDALGRITAVHFPDDTTVGYTYTTTGDLDVVTDQLANETIFHYLDEDAEGEVGSFYGNHRLESWNDDGQPAAAVWTYDADGRVISKADGEGVFTELDGIDIDGMTYGEIGPDPALTTTYQYDGGGTLLTMTQSWEAGEDYGAGEYVTSYTYDEAYRITSVTAPSGGTSSYVYDEAGRVVWSEDAAGVVTETSYFENGKVQQHKVGGTVSTTNTLNANGRIATTADGLGRTTTLVYNDRGQLIQSNFPDGRIMVTFYDGATGYPTGAVRPDGVSVTMTIDAAVRPLSVTSSGTGTVTTGYDAVGNATSREDELGHIQNFGFDEDGHMISYTDKVGRTVSYVFDDAGRLASQTNREAEEVTYTYDPAGRLSAVAGSGVSRSFGYDPLGRVVRAVNGSIVVSRTYNQDGMASETMTGPGFGPITQTFDADDAGRMASVGGPWGEVAYGYDHRGRLASVTDQTLGVFTYGYNNADEQMLLQRPGALRTNFEYDNGGRTTWTTTEDALGHPLHSSHYEFDNRGFPSSKTDMFGPHFYGHDAAGRLTSVDHPPMSHFGDEAYTYDGASRRTAWQGNPAEQVVYDDGDRLLQDASWDYVYDNEGRRVSKASRDDDTGATSTWTYTWNGLAQLQSVTSPSAETWSFVYDAFDRRVQVVGPEAVQWIVFDHELVRALYDGEGELTERFVTGFGFGEVLARVSDGNVVSYSTQDGVGTTSVWFDGNGGRSDMEWNAAGVSSSDLSQPFGYTGHFGDSSGLTWGRARYLDPNVGSWLSEDPLYFDEPYGYVSGRMLTRSDPTGFMAERSGMSKFAVCAAVVTVAGTLVVIAESNVEGIATVLQGGDFVPSWGVNSVLAEVVVSGAIFGCALAAIPNYGPLPAPGSGPKPFRPKWNPKRPTPDFNENAPNPTLVPK